MYKLLALAQIKYFLGEETMCNRLLLSILALVFLSASTVQANLLVNGDFDDDTGYALNSSGWFSAASITGWTGNQTIEIQTQATIGVTPYSGNYYAEINADPGQAGTFSFEQSFTTVSGTFYKVEFWYRSRKANDGFFDVSINGETKTVTNDDDSQWRMYMFTFGADDTFETLEFISTDPGSDTVGHLIDSVSVTKVPVPAAVWLFGTALAGLFAARSRQAKN
jgi:hypothetical protein